VAVATVPATLALIGTLSLGAVQIVTDDPHRSGEMCITLVERVADLAKKNPKLADIYATQEGPGLPRLYDAEEIQRCGDPAPLVRALAP